MRVHVTDLQPGDLMQHDVYNDNGVHVLRKGTVLQIEEISKLIQHSVDYIEIEPREVLITADSSSDTPETLHQIKPQFDQAVESISSIFMDALKHGKFHEDLVDDAFKPVVETLMKQKDVVSLLLLLNGQDDYTSRHSMQVGMLSYYLATWMGYNDDEAYEIGKAGYLHDIGKCRIPLEILNKPSKLTYEEFEEVKRHTLYGYDIIRESMDDELTALVALQHHERDDGKGYPLKLRSKQIHPYSHIAAVADVYSAMSSNRVYQSKQQLLHVLRELHTMSFGQLNGKPVHAFIKHMLPNFIGKKVLLTSGESGTIVMTNPSDFFRPLVRTSDRFIDLSKEPDSAIHEIKF
ncbi:HD-GYP domain-containing protein [Paenibacillus lemnae]|uniref:HD-GYP domain-containing protein n=1 Tax=Paenibacillus lemnae TaxID=1330551 RepID=A0A848M4J4_PAELE|nr:HD-GYP domain-containing protein [Paenibacillus lemnae]NMO95526.1 HD-GYP domain-containing protein [Paenibacillus lemnae]